MKHRRSTRWPVAATALLLQVAAAQIPTANYRSPEQVRAEFHKLLDRPSGDLKPDFRSEKIGDLMVESGSFFSEPGEKVPTVIMKQTGRTGRLPVIVCLHGTGGDKTECSSLLRQFARRGYLAMAIDARYHGDRVPGGANGSRQYNDAVIAAWRTRPEDKQTHPFWYDTAYDLWRTVDYLVSRPDVDPDRIGMIGISMGGIQVWLGASVDTRVKVSVPIIAVQSLRWSLENDRWQPRAATIAEAHAAAARDLMEPRVNQRVVRTLWNKIVPGILDEFDNPSMIRLFAPRPLLILNAERDPNNPLPGAELAFEQAKAAYATAGALDRLKIYVAPGVAHEVTAEHLRLADEWFDRWLAP